MFHSDTDQQVKDFVMKSFSCNDGIVRVIFATIAFGMGGDCKGLTTVIMGHQMTLMIIFRKVVVLGVGSQMYAMHFFYCIQAVCQVN